MLKDRPLPQSGADWCVVLRRDMTGAPEKTIREPNADQEEESPGPGAIKRL